MLVIPANTMTKHRAVMFSKYLVLCFLIAGAWAGEDDVFEWTDGDFAQELERHENTLVMFYAPW